MLYIKLFPLAFVTLKLIVPLSSPAHKTSVLVTVNSGGSIPKTEIDVEALQPLKS